MLHSPSGFHALLAVFVHAAESPDDQGKARMRLRSGNAKVHSSPGLADTDIAVTRRSSRHASAAKHHKGSSDEDEDVEPSAKRQLDMPIIDQVGSIAS